jgi:hypothetical protein
MPCPAAASLGQFSEDTSTVSAGRGAGNALPRQQLCTYEHISRPAEYLFKSSQGLEPALYFRFGVSPPTIISMRARRCKMTDLHIARVSDLVSTAAVVGILECATNLGAHHELRSNVEGL